MRTNHYSINGNLYSGKRVDEAFEIVSAMVNNKFQQVDLSKIPIAEIAGMNAFGLAVSEFKRRHGGTERDAKHAVEYLTGEANKEIG